MSDITQNVETIREYWASLPSWRCERLDNNSKVLYDVVAALLAKVDEQDAQLEELDFLRHEGGAQSVAAMEETLRDTVLPLLRRYAEDMIRCIAVGADPATISGADWRDVADDMEAILAVEKFVGRPDDEHACVLDPILDAASWRAHL